MVDERGVFSYTFSEEVGKFGYTLLFPDGASYFDPYNFSIITSKEDEYYFAQGVHYTLFEVLGAKILEHEGILGTRFSVWAPKAKSVALIADCNSFEAGYHPMRRIGDSGIWELFFSKPLEGMLYKYAVYSDTGGVVYKTDPMARGYELRPQTAARVCKETFVFTDEAWMKNKPAVKHEVLSRPINVYEMHLGSWKRSSGEINYRTLAHLLAEYLKEMSFTHVEILPVCEHPLDESWGYQVTGYFAPTSRYGNYDDFAYFVNHLHENGIGVILDWTPGHFPADGFALREFDGGPLYEKNHDVMRWHPEWDTLIFDYEKPEVVAFLLSSAFFWVEKLHVDGLRVDAVQSILYLDYSRHGTAWVPNQYGGPEDLAAIEFLKHLNSMMAKRSASAIMIAEDASLYPSVTIPTYQGGLGFDLKWNIGWMNDTLRFFVKDPVYRKYHLQELLNTFTEVFREKYILPLSHDEVVHEKKHLILKMPLDMWHKFGHMRLCYSYAMCHPGKKLFFMGIEIAQIEEWDPHKELPWHLLQEENHRKWFNFVKYMNRFYLSEPTLWQTDFDPGSFEWVHQHVDRSIIAYIRRGEKRLFFVHNFTPMYYENEFIPLRNASTIRELLNTDGMDYGGGGVMNASIRIEPGTGVWLTLAPLSSLICELD